MKDVPPPRQRDKMPGKYWGHGWQQIFVGNVRQPFASRWRRPVDKQQLRRYLARRKDDE